MLAAVTTWTTTGNAMISRKQQYRIQVLLLVLTLLLVSLVLPACSSTARYVSEPLPIPEKPYLPQVKAKELSCVSDATYKKLVTRDVLRRQFEEELIAIIQSTHQPNQRNPPE